MNTQYTTSFTEEDRKLFREWLRSHLSYGPTQVTFTKKDGTVRTMNCTTKSELVEAYEKKTDKPPNEETCFVYDLDKQAWRSFRYDSITGVTFIV